MNATTADGNLDFQLTAPTMMTDFTIKLLKKTIATQNRLLIYHKSVLIRLGPMETGAIQAAHDAIDRTEQNLRDLKRSARILTSVKKLQLS